MAPTHQYTNTPILRKNPNKYFYPIHTNAHIMGRSNKQYKYKYSEYKTKEERQEQVKTILNEITKLGLSIQYQPVKDLYVHLRTYIEQGVAVKINIPFDEIDRTIVGELKIGKKEECVICLQTAPGNKAN